MSEMDDLVKRREKLEREIDVLHKAGFIGAVVVLVVYMFFVIGCGALIVLGIRWLWLHV